MFVYNAAAMSARNVTTVNNFTKYVIDNFSMTSGNIRVGVISEGRQGGDIDLSQVSQKTDFTYKRRKSRKQEKTLSKRSRKQAKKQTKQNKVKRASFVCLCVLLVR